MSTPVIQKPIKIEVDKKDREIHDVLILDKSGSMGIVRDETIAGVNKYITQMKEAAKKYQLKTFVTLIMFDKNVRTVFANQPINEVPLLTTDTYVPSGLTALADAAGEGIKQLRETLKGREASDDIDVTMTLYTDGQEADSTTYTMAQINSMIKELTDEFKWTFTFAGAGAQEEVRRAAAGFGINHSNVQSYDVGAAGATESFSLMREARSMKMADFGTKGLKSSVGYYTGGATNAATPVDDVPTPMPPYNVINPSTQEVTPVSFKQLREMKRPLQTAVSHPLIAPVPASWHLPQDNLNTAADVVTEILDATSLLTSSLYPSYNMAAVVDQHDIDSRATDSSSDSSSGYDSSDSGSSDSSGSDSSSSSD